MPFGLKISQDVFQMQMDQATDPSPGIIAIHSNICIFDCTPKEHEWHLLWLMQTAKDHGIVFNSAECHIRQPQIAFYDAVFTAQGMQPDPSKTFQPLTSRQSFSPSWAWSTIYSPSYPVYQPKQHSYMNSSPGGTGTLLQTQHSSTLKSGSVRPSSMLPWCTMTDLSLLWYKQMLVSMGWGCLAAKWSPNSLCQ